MVYVDLFPGHDLQICAHRATLLFVVYESFSTVPLGLLLRNPERTSGCYDSNRLEISIRVGFVSRLGKCPDTTAFGVNSKN